MYILEVGGRRWKVREAVSEQFAIDEIYHAMALGSIGGKTTSGEIVLADVVQINSDGTERQPYTMEY